MKLGDEMGKHIREVDFRLDWKLQKNREAHLLPQQQKQKRNMEKNREA